MRGLFSTVAAAAAALGGNAWAELPVLSLNAGIHLIRAEVAYTFDTRAKGLMFRETLGPNDGMLFIFPDEARHCMWMRNTLIPLSVAFIDRRGAIVNVQEMKPRTEESHCSARAVPYALEMNSNWFASKGLKPGARVGGIEKAPPPQ